MKSPTDKRNNKSEWLLYGGIKSLLRSDDAAVVKALAHYIISQYRILQTSVSLIERMRRTPIPSIIALLSGMKRFLEVRGARHQRGAVWIARLNNERRVVENLSSFLPEINWSELKFRQFPDLAGVSALIRNLVPNRRRIFRIARRLHRRHEFFKVFRVAELISYYIRYLAVFQNNQFDLAIVSSHSSPHGIAFNLAARRCGIPTVLITHGMPVRPVATLAFDLAIVNCEAAKQIYLEAGWQMKRVIVHGRRQNYAPMPASLSEKIAVGIFLCKDVNEKTLRGLVKILLGDWRVRSVSIRPHPKNLWRGLDAWIAEQNNARLNRSVGKSVFEDVKAVDIVFGGNSSVLVEAVTAGRLGVYVANLDYGSTDLHEFVKRGLIYQWEDKFNFAPGEILRFYQQPEWINALRFFADIDTDEESTARQISAAMREIIAENQT